VVRGDGGGERLTGGVEHLEGRVAEQGAGAGADVSHDEHRVVVAGASLQVGERAVQLPGRAGGGPRRGRGGGRPDPGDGEDRGRRGDDDDPHRAAPRRPGHWS